MTPELWPKYDTIGCKCLFCNKVGLYLDLKFECHLSKNHFDCNLELTNLMYCLQYLSFQYEYHCQKADYFSISYCNFDTIVNSSIYYSASNSYFDKVFAK